MKIKIKRRWNLACTKEYDPMWFYDIYHGFFNWFRIKWVDIKGFGDSERAEELLKILEGE